MNAQFYIILQQIFKFMVIILIGIGCVKFKVLDQKGLPVISKLIIRVVLPIFILSNTISSATRDDLFSDAAIVPLGALVYVILIIAAFIMSRCLGLKADKRQIFEALFIFGNVGFIGIPLIVAILPEKGMVYVALFTIVDQIVLWTLGVELTSKDMKGFNIKNLKKMINPPLVAILIAILIVLSGVRIPVPVSDVLRAVGGVSSPLCLIYIGGCLCFCNFKRILKCKEIYIGTIVKMIIIPIAIFFFIDHCFPVPNAMSLTMALIAALPTMTTIPMLAMQNDMEGDYCVSATLLLHTFCLITLPIVSFVMFLF